MTIAATTDTTLTFVQADRMEANRPYLIAVPGPAYGDRSLQGKMLTFTAQEVVVRQTATTADNTDCYSFAHGAYGAYGAYEAYEAHEAHTPHEPHTPQVATSSAELTATSYQLNAEGNNFTGTLRKTPPFRAALLRYSR